MCPCIVSPTGEVVYEGVDCDDAFNELRKWFHAHTEKIMSGKMAKLIVVDIDSERLIKRDNDKYVLGEAWKG